MKVKDALQTLYKNDQLLYDIGRGGHFGAKSEDVCRALGVTDERIEKLDLPDKLGAYLKDCGGGVNIPKYVTADQMMACGVPKRIALKIQAFNRECLRLMTDAWDIVYSEEYHPNDNLLDLMFG